MAKQILTGLDLLALPSLTTPKTGSIGFGAKSDGLYQKTGSEESKLATQSDIDTAIDGIEIGGRNLADWKSIIKQVSYENIGGNKYLLNPKRVNDGFKPKTDKLNIGEEAVLSYKIKYISGLLINFGGHCVQSVTKILVDGVAISNLNYHVGLSKSYIEDGEEHLIQIFFKKNATPQVHAHIGIELNRYYNDPFDSFIEVWDIKLERGTKATDWTPAPEDQVSDWNITDVASFSYIKNKPTQLSQFTDNIGVGSHIANKANPHAVTKAQVGLSNVDNTSDVNKPVSTAVQSALNLKANLASPTFTGNVTASVGINTPKVDFGNGFTIEPSGTELVFKYNGVIKQRMLSDGTILATGGITALST